MQGVTKQTDSKKGASNSKVHHVSQFISVDEFLLTIMEPWDQLVRRMWRNHMVRECVCV